MQSRINYVCFVFFPPDKHENYINLTQDNNIYTISIRAGTNNVQWSVDVDAHPVVQNVWYRISLNNTISPFNLNKIPQF